MFHAFIQEDHLKHDSAAAQEVVTIAVITLLHFFLFQY